MGKESRLTPTLRRALVAAAAVVGLALLIFGASALSSARRPGESSASTTQLSAEGRSDVLARRALTAASKDDTLTARSLAESALKLNAANQTAAGVIARLDQTRSASDPASSTPKPAAQDKSPAPANPDKWTQPAKNIATLLPKTVAGWVAGTVVAQGGDALVTFTPAQGSSSDSKVVRVTFNVHDLKSPSAASKFVASVDRKVYPGDGSTVKVGGADGYFGTDGARLAVVAFSRGRFAFEVVAYSQQGIKPSTLRTLALDLASSVPAAR